jgi:hypothetical protein
MECILQQTTDVETAYCWASYSGVNLDEFLPVIDARRDKLTTEEVIQYGRRTDIPDDQIATLLQAQGWYRRNEAIAKVQLYDELPSINDHLHWLQRNVFDDEYVRDYDLLNGFEERFWTKFGHDLHSLGYTKDRASLEYAAHWINPSPEQLKEMVYRLNPDIYSGEFPFTVNDYQRILAEQDIGSYFRPRFAEIIYRIPALTYIIGMYRANIIDDAGLGAYHQQLGYSKVDSTRFVAVDRIQKIRMRAAQSGGWTPSRLANAWSVNQISAAEMDAEFERLGYTQDESEAARAQAQAALQHSVFIRARSRALQSIVANVTSAIKIGITTVDQAAQMLIDAGYPSDFAKSLSQSALVSGQVARIQRAISRIRTAFDSGEISVDYALSALLALGIEPASANNYLAVWSLELTPGRKRRSATQIVNDVSFGVMATDEALVRLHNLGYSDADSMLFLADANRKIADREAKLLAQEERLIAKRNAELARLAKEAQRQQEEAIAALRREEPPEKLQKWAAMGLVNREYFYDRLRLYGFDDPSIDLWWEQACAKKGAACVNGQAQ